MIAPLRATPSAGLRFPIPDSPLQWATWRQTCPGGHCLGWIGAT
jgi:hypothetical protein